MTDQKEEGQAALSHETNQLEAILAKFTTPSGPGKRLLKELRDLMEKEDCHCPGVTFLDLEDDNLFEWHILLEGLGPPYKGRRFHLKLTFPSKYPFSPFKLEFLTPIVHPNISRGRFCCSLRELKLEWSPSHTVVTVMQSVRKLLQTPDGLCVVQEELFELYKNDKTKYEQVVQELMKKLKSNEGYIKKEVILAIANQF